MTKRYALLGAAGFIAPRHVRAIKETGGELVACCDPHDSVGYLDSYFPECRYFREYERFMRFIDKDGGIDTVVVCTPNYLHDTHTLFAMKEGCNVICEKPAVIHMENLERLMEAEMRYGKKVNVILQLRHHPEIVALKRRIDGLQSLGSPSPVAVSLQYNTPRGVWYHNSWKADREKSGGLAVNIGVHLFDMLAWVFGSPCAIKVDRYDSEELVGDLLLQNARVIFSLSIKGNFKNDELTRGTSAYRSMIVGDDVVDFSNITNLHIVSYAEILLGRGWSLKDCVESTKVTEKINET